MVMVTLFRQSGYQDGQFCRFDPFSHLFFFYVPFFLIQFLVFVLTIVAVVKLHFALYTSKQTSAALLRRKRLMQLRIALYSLIFLLGWLPSLCSFLYYLLFRCSSTWLLFLEVIFVPSVGTVNSLVFMANKELLHSYKALFLRCKSKLGRHLADTADDDIPPLIGPGLVITEETEYSDLEGDDVMADYNSAGNKDSHHVSLYAQLLSQHESEDRTVDSLTAVHRDSLQ
jgi:hypothetical protein